MSTKSNAKKSTKANKGTKGTKAATVASSGSGNVVTGITANGSVVTEHRGHVYPAVVIVDGMPESKKVYVVRAAVSGGSKGGAKKVWQRALNGCKAEIEKTLRAASLTGYRSNVAKAGHTSIGVWARVPASK